MFEMAWLCDQLEKIDSPDVQAAEKVIRFAMQALKRSTSSDAVKSQLSEKKLATLLGAERVKSIAAEF